MRFRDQRAADPMYGAVQCVRCDRKSKPERPIPRACPRCEQETIVGTHNPQARWWRVVRLEPR